MGDRRIRGGLKNQLYRYGGGGGGWGVGGEWVADFEKPLELYCMCILV